METSDECLANSSRQGPVNLFVEHGMYLIAEDLERLLKLVAEADVPYEEIGGLAGNAHLLAASHRSRSFVTRDDLLIRRQDLEKLVAAANRLGYTAKRMIGGYALLFPGQQLAEAIHLLFVGEKPKSSYPVVNPNLHPDRKDLFGFTIPVAPILDLITLKLNSLRPKDVVHLDILDQVGFLTPEIVSALDPILPERLS